MADLESLKREQRIKAQIAALRLVVTDLWAHVNTKDDPRMVRGSDEEKAALLAEHAAACERRLAARENDVYEMFLEVVEDKDPGIAAHIDDRPDPAGPQPGSQA